MEKSKKDITTIFLSLLCSLIVIITFFGTFISNQSKIDTQLVSIQADVTEINVKLDKREEEIKELTNRIVVLETREENK